MSAKDKNPTVNRFVQLTADLPSFAGMRRSGNPASLPPFLFRDLENIAMRGNDLVERGGQEKYNPDTPLDDCGDGFLPPDEEPNPYDSRMLIQVTREAGGEGDTDLRLYSSGITELASTLTRPVSMTYLPGTGPGGAGGRLFWSTWTASDENGDLVNEFSLTASDKEVIVAQAILSSDVGGGGELARFDSDDFAVTNMGGTGLSVVRDPFGSSPVVEITNAAPPDNNQGPWLREFDSELVCPLDPEVVYRRGIGSAGWATSAVPLGCTINIYRPSSVALFNGELYFTGSAAGFYALMKMDTSGVITLVTLVTGLSVPTPLSSPQPVCVHNGVLWMADGQALAYWTGTDLIEFPTNFFLTNNTLQLVSFRGKLWALREDELWSSRYPHSIDSWVRASSIPGAFGYAVVHPIL